MAMVMKGLKIPIIKVKCFKSYFKSDSSILTAKALNKRSQVAIKHENKETPISAQKVRQVLKHKLLFISLLAFRINNHSLLKNNISIFMELVNKCY